MMDHPLPLGRWENEDLEFLELKNKGANVLDLGLMSFTSGIEFVFPIKTLLTPGAFFVLGRNLDALQERYPGLAVNGIYSGKLNNDGELLRLSTPAGKPVFELSYSNQSPWPSAAAGAGYSIVLRSATTNSSSPTGWRASAHLGGSPGVDDPEDTISDSDGDGMRDWQERLAGTDPADPHSVLNLEYKLEAGQVKLSFQSAPKHGYIIQYTTDLASGRWETLLVVDPTPEGRVVEVPELKLGERGFYRLLVPVADGDF
jgi:hypothetical protein